MTKQDKQLLLRDLCARLPYNVVIRCTDNDTDYKCFLTTNILNELLYSIEYYDYKPYLRPMSSMTEEEKKKVYYFVESHKFGNCSRSGAISDYLNSIHIDYRNLIEKGLALEAPEGMYKNE